MSNPLSAEEEAARQEGYRDGFKDGRVKTREKLVRVAEEWAQQRGLDLSELLFRMKTASV